MRLVLGVSRQYGASPHARSLPDVEKIEVGVAGGDGRGRVVRSKEGSALRSAFIRNTDYLLYTRSTTHVQIMIMFYFFSQTLTCLCPVSFIKLNKYKICWRIIS